MNRFPIITGLFGSILGWFSVDALLKAQFFAGLTAGLVSLCTLIIVLPKAIDSILAFPAKCREWRAKWATWRNG